MTLATASASLLSPSSVAAFIRDQWIRAGDDAEVVRDVIVLVPRLRRVEWVLEDLEDDSQITDAVSTFVAQGIDVALVLPVHLLGRAHAEFHGIATHLVGWVDQEDGRPHFMAPERA